MLKLKLSLIEICKTTFARVKIQPIVGITSGIFHTRGKFLLKTACGLIDIETQLWVGKGGFFPFLVVSNY